MRQLHGYIVGAAAALGQVGYAMAQIPDKPGPPATSSPLMTWGIVIVLVAIACAGAMKSAKRGHQD